MDSVKKQKGKVAFIDCWFGTFPRYFNLFVNSCSYNPDYDFLIFSDAKYEDPLPANVKIIQMTIPEFRKIAAKKLGFEVNIDKPYLMCDMKPAYGHILEDYIEGYGYWGLCDLDLLLGDLNAFLNSYIEEDYDVINVKKEYVSGALSVYKNSEFINKIYTESKDYKFSFQSPRYESFDECGHEWPYLKAGGSIFESDSPIETITHILFKAREENRIKAFFESVILESRDDIFKHSAIWEKGKVVCDGKTYIAIHFVQAKYKYHFIFPKWKLTPPRILINQLGLLNPYNFRGAVYTFLGLPLILSYKTILKIGEKLNLPVKA